ncbi:MAG: pyruvate kinase [Candidatus Woesearchaeota archaeon]
MQKKTKIIATIGPASIDYGILKKMIEQGMNIARINTAHGSYEQYELIINNLDKIKKELNIKVPILLDVKGPEIRIISNKEYKLNYKDRIKIYFSSNFYKKNFEKKDFKKMPYFNHKFKPKKGNKILINDGLNELEIIKVNPDNLELKALMPLIINNKLRINIPGNYYDAEILTENDKKVILNFKNRFDFLALSYVRNKKDLSYVRDFLKKNNIDCKIVSKIENIEAVKNFDEILEYSDAIMVARGDLGVELPSEKVPLIQKEIIKKCNQKGKAVITATQMLQTMVNYPIPTRAETSDVANSILDGTDAIMLSAESASGKYPIESIKEMTKIAKEVEPYVESKVNYEIKKEKNDKINYISQAISKSISEITNLINIKKVIALTHTGFTAKMLSRYKLKQPIYALCDEKTEPELILYYGVMPFVVDKIDYIYLKKFIQNLVKENKLLKEDLILVAYGQEKQETNLIEVNYVDYYLKNN